MFHFKVLEVAVNSIFSFLQALERPIQTRIRVERTQKVRPNVKGEVPKVTFYDQEAIGCGYGKGLAVGDGSCSFVVSRNLLKDKTSGCCVVCTGGGEGEHLNQVQQLSMLEGSVSRDPRGITFLP